MAAPPTCRGDRGYDGVPIHEDPRDQGATPEIPTGHNRHVQHGVSLPLHALRSRIECFINRLWNSRRVASRRGKTDDGFLVFSASPVART